MPSAKLKPVSAAQAKTNESRKVSIQRRCLPRAFGRWSCHAGAVGWFATSKPPPPRSSWFSTTSSLATSGNMEQSMSNIMNATEEIEASTIQFTVVANGISTTSDRDTDVELAQAWAQPADKEKLGGMSAVFSFCSVREISF